MRSCFNGGKGGGRNGKVQTVDCGIFSLPTLNHDSVDCPRACIQVEVEDGNLHEPTFLTT